MHTADEKIVMTSRLFMKAGGLNGDGFGLFDHLNFVRVWGLARFDVRADPAPDLLRVVLVLLAGSRGHFEAVRDNQRWVWRV